MAIFGVLVTFKRPDELRNSLRVLAGQTHPLDGLVIVDNDPSGAVGHSSPLPQAARRQQLLKMKSNTGPAGGLARGVHVLVSSFAQDCDWILFLDDDDPPRNANAIADLLAFAERCVEQDHSTAGVGLIGARLGRWSGTLLRPRDDELDGPVAVDYIGGGQLPLYRVAALRACGMPCPDLFFGFDDLDLGLRLRGAGHSLYCDGQVWRLMRTRDRRTGLKTVLATRSLSLSNWRTYYSHRNIVHVLVRHGFVAGAVARSVVIFGKLGVALVRQPRVARRSIAITMLGLRDGWFGRLGRSIDPT